MTTYSSFSTSRLSGLLVSAAHPSASFPCASRFYASGLCASRLAASLLASVLLIGGASASHAALIPTEIYYNGPLPGADADEFVELTNSGSTLLELVGYRFEAGLGLTFPDISLAPLETLVVAPNPDGFSQRFASYRGPLLDATGGLSNSGEALTLVDGAGTVIFALSYDDSGDWPESADGSGDSLQLRAGIAALSDAASWRAGPPTPGLWAGNAAPEEETDDKPPVRSVPIPSSLGLALTGLLLLGAGRTASGVVRGAPLHNIHGRSYQWSVFATIIGQRPSRSVRPTQRASHKTPPHVRVFHCPTAYLRFRSGAAGV